MKAKIRKTGEIVDVIAFKSSEACPEKDWVRYVDSEGLDPIQELNALEDLEVIDKTEDKAVDWEQRRYDLAKRYSIEFVKLQHHQGRTECGILYSKVVGWSVELADELIAKLKEGGKE